MANFNNLWKQINPKGRGDVELRRQLARISKHLSIADGVNIRPGDDIDTDIFVVHVSGLPTLSWDESEDQLVFSHGILCNDGGGDPIESFQSQTAESFIRFKGTAASADLSKSIAAEGDVTTATRQGFVQVFVEDLGNQITDQKYYIPVYTLV